MPPGRLTPLSNIRERYYISPSSPEASASVLLESSVRPGFFSVRGNAPRSHSFLPRGELTSGFKSSHVLAAPLRKLNNGSGKHAVGIVGQVQAGKSFSVPGGRERLVPGAGDEERVSGAEPQVVLIPYVTISLVIPCKGHK